MSKFGDDVCCVVYGSKNYKLAVNFAAKLLNGTAEKDDFLKLSQECVFKVFSMCFYDESIDKKFDKFLEEIEETKNNVQKDTTSSNGGGGSSSSSNSNSSSSNSSSNSNSNSSSNSNSNSSSVQELYQVTGVPEMQVTLRDAEQNEWYVVPKCKKVNEVEDASTIKKGVCLVCEENIGKDGKRNECICGAIEYKKTAVNETKVDLYGNVTTNMRTKTETVYKGKLNFEGDFEF